MLPKLGATATALPFKPEWPNIGCPLPEAELGLSLAPAPLGCSWGAHGLAELGPPSFACGASADLAVLLPVLTRNLSYLQGAASTPGGSAFRAWLHSHW